MDGFEDADVVVEGEFNYPHGSCAAIEPHGAIVWFNEDNTIEVWSSSICPFIIREDLAHFLRPPSFRCARAHPGDRRLFRLQVRYHGRADRCLDRQLRSRPPGEMGGDPQGGFHLHADRARYPLTHEDRRAKDGKLSAIETEVLHSTGAYADTG